MSNNENQEQNTIAVKVENFRNSLRVKPKVTNKTQKLNLAYQ
jgi:hypothetical protein